MIACRGSGAALVLSGTAGRALTTELAADGVDSSLEDAGALFAASEDAEMLVKGSRFVAFLEFCPVSTLEET